MKFSHLPRRLKEALREDGAFDDITTQLLGFGSTVLQADLMAKKQGVFCGGFLMRPIFEQLAKKVQIRQFLADGKKVQPGTRIAHLRGPARALLAGERVFLNLACHLSGISTLTRRFVDEVRGTKAQILDTRKTTPLWRDLEKYAVLCGGGTNHRMSLSDAILIKDNHRQLLKRAGRRLAIRRPIGKKATFLEIEAANLPEVWDAIMAKADAVLLDNMPVKLIKESIALIRSAQKAQKKAFPQIEISGGVTLQNVRGLARLGVDRISVGALTHSAPALDLSLEVL